MTAAVPVGERTTLPETPDPPISYHPGSELASIHLHELNREC